jgi:hypothetical protein
MGIIASGFRKLRSPGTRLFNKYSNLAMRRPARRLHCHCPPERKIAQMRQRETVIAAAKNNKS